jgi:hypothetical protein
VSCLFRFGCAEWPKAFAIVATGFELEEALRLVLCDEPVDDYGVSEGFGAGDGSRS